MANEQHDTWNGGRRDGSAELWEPRGNRETSSHTFFHFERFLEILTRSAPSSNLNEPVPHARLIFTGNDCSARRPDVLALASRPGSRKRAHKYTDRLRPGRLRNKRLNLDTGEGRENPSNFGKLVYDAR